MKYNAKYDRWFTKDGLVYRYSKNQDKLIICKQSKCTNGYIQFHSKLGHKMVHRAVYETFIGEIPDGYQIDHINTIRDDNRLENLRVATPKENNNNPLTKKHMSESMKGKSTKWLTGKKQDKEHVEKRVSKLVGKRRGFTLIYSKNTGIPLNEIDYKKLHAAYAFYKKHNGMCDWEKYR